ncbi:Os12g0110700, partial [Oryza sativa Japonica Group]
RAGQRATAMAGNCWTQELEEEMRGVHRLRRGRSVGVRRRSVGVRRGRPLRRAGHGEALAGAAALAAAFIGSGEAGAWASGIAVLCGALAAAVNTVEHGGQVGMVFKLCRNVAGIYRKIQEDIKANLKEADVERRENGEVFETKVALQLGRSTSELKQFRAIASPAVKDEDIKEFAGAGGKEDRAEPGSVPPPWWWSQYSTTRARAAPLTTSGRLTTTSSSPPPPRPSSSILLIVPDAAVITFDEDGAGAAGSREWEKKKRAPPPPSAGRRRSAAAQPSAPYPSAWPAREREREREQRGVEGREKRGKRDDVDT